MLTILAAGVASGQQTAHAIAHWALLQADHLRAALPDLTRLPSESILLRTLQQIAAAVLEAALAHLTQPHTAAQSAPSQVVTPCGTILQTQAVDGKALRGAPAVALRLIWSAWFNPDVG